MLTEAQQEKSRYYGGTLSSGRYAAVTFGMPRFVPIDK